MNPDLIRLPDIAHLIGRTRGYVYQMHHNDKLPEPAFDDGVVKLWDRATIIEWDRTRNKTPGRRRNE